ncbi:MAG: type II secretion system major pseudopilin GspG [Desulfobacterales bacterium]
MKSNFKTPFLNPLSLRTPGQVKKQAGFTLIELMVVIVILSILAVYVAPKLVGREEQAKQVKARVDIQALETALKLYKLDNGRYPTTEQGLEALVEPPDTGKVPENWREGGYIEKGKIASDPWGNDYIYLSPGSHGDYDIISYGADGEPGGQGDNKDIKSWEIE